VEGEPIFGKNSKLPLAPVIDVSNPIRPGIDEAD